MRAEHNSVHSSSHTDFRSTVILLSFIIRWATGNQKNEQVQAGGDHHRHLCTFGKQELFLLLHKKTLIVTHSRWRGGHGPELQPFFSTWIPVIILAQEHESLLQTHAIIQMRKPVNDENNEDGLQEEGWKKKHFIR